MCQFEHHRFSDAIAPKHDGGPLLLEHDVVVIHAKQPFDVNALDPDV
jgi:hypothetical protein